MDDIHCIGTEEYVLQCPYRGWGKDDCGNSEWAGVTCRKEWKLWTKFADMISIYQPPSLIIFCSYIKYHKKLLCYDL